MMQAPRAEDGHARDAADGAADRAPVGALPAGTAVAAAPTRLESSARPVHHQLRVLRIDGLGADPRPMDGALERVWQSIDLELPAGQLLRPLEAARAGQLRLDTSPLGWADVVLFSGRYATLPTCDSCGLAWDDDAPAQAHSRESGHVWRRPWQQAVRCLVETAARWPAVWRTRAVAYALDADPWADAQEVPALDLDLVRTLLSTADVVLAATRDAAAAAVREGAAPDRVVRAAGDDTAARLEALARAAATAGGDRFARRVAQLDADAEVAARLAGRQAAGLPSWDADAAQDPLVSVVVPVVDEPAVLVEQAVRSALGAEGVRLEVLVAGAAASPARAAVAAVDDCRVRLIAVAPASPARGARATETVRRADVARETAFAAAAAAGDAAASGLWIAHLRPGAVMTPEHPSTLLGVAVEYGLDIVYGQTLLIEDDVVIGARGAWPPSAASIAPDAALVSAALRGIGPDAQAAEDGEPVVWNQWRRYAEAGARIANIEGALAARLASREGAAESLRFDGAPQ